MKQLLVKVPQDSDAGEQAPERKQGEGRPLQDKIEENLVAEQELAALLRARISGEK